MIFQFFTNMTVEVMLLIDATIPGYFATFVVLHVPLGIEALLVAALDDYVLVSLVDSVAVFCWTKLLVQGVDYFLVEFIRA